MMCGTIATLDAHGRRVAIEVDPDDHISQPILAGEFYERDLLEDVFKRAPVGVAIDVGAHIGNHSLWFAIVCELFVVALEPSEASYVRLGMNFCRNNAKARWIRAAAGAKRGRCRVEEACEGNSGTARITEDARGDVPVVPLDCLGVRNVSLLKIDVEGSELAVLWGAHQMIARDRPLIYVEAATNDAHRAVENYLRAYGYWQFGCFAKTPTYGFRAA
jgi:FkbM family methyltransferase